MTILDAAKQRYTTKAYDATRKISAEHLEQLLELIRLSPSSINAQPWHFVVADHDAGKSRIAKSMQAPGSAYNAAKVTAASAVIVFASRIDITPEYLNAMLEQEERDGRFNAPEAKAARRKSCQGFIDLHRYERKDVQPWLEKQVYIALGTLLLGAATLNIDATPMEGFDFKVLDEELGLRERGYTSLVVVALGYRDAEDFNAKAPKSRLPAEAVMTRI